MLSDGSAFEGDHLRDLNQQSGFPENRPIRIRHFASKV